MTAGPPLSESAPFAAGSSPARPASCASSTHSRACCQTTCNFTYSALNPPHFQSSRIDPASLASTQWPGIAQPGGKHFATTTQKPRTFSPAKCNNGSSRKTSARFQTVNWLFYKEKAIPSTYARGIDSLNEPITSRRPRAAPIRQISIPRSHLVSHHRHLWKRQENHSAPPLQKHVFMARLVRNARRKQSTRILLMAADQQRPHLSNIPGKTPKHPLVLIQGHSH